MANLDTFYSIDQRVTAFERHERGMLVCLAGPGTGKTFSLLARSQALAARGCDQDAICYLTFIREIANAFSDDYVERFGEDAYATAAPRISTLHSFACRLIRNQGFRINYDGELYFANLAEHDTAANTFLGDLLPFVTREGCRTIPQLRNVVQGIKRSWQDDVDPATSAEPVPTIVRRLAESSRCFRLLDWDQTIPIAGMLLVRLTKPPEWLSKIRHYFVDEYQDFNRAEQRLILHLAGVADSMVVVGDDDQSLYSGRGGSPDGIRTLYAAQEHDQVTLVKCYRCKGNIVAPANTFQAYMSATPRPMVAATAGGQVMCYRFKSSKTEVLFLADYLKARIAELPERPGTKDGVVCLFPSKRILNTYYEMLGALVPCTKRGRDIPERRLWLGEILTLLVRPKQRFAERLLLNDYGDLKPRHRAAIVRRVLERDVSPSEACGSLIGDGEFTGKALAAGKAFVQLCTCLIDRDLPLLARQIAAVLPVAEDPLVEELERLLHVDALTQGDAVEDLCDRLLPDTAAPTSDMRAALFLTMHGAKGLTRKTVVLPGLEEACLPDGGDAAGLPEKQRLFFVALSRATDNLLLTMPHNRGRNDGLNFPMPGRGDPSRFIAAAGLVVEYHT